MEENMKEKKNLEVNSEETKKEVEELETLQKELVKEEKVEAKPAPRKGGPCI